MLNFTLFAIQKYANHTFLKGGLLRARRALSPGARACVQRAILLKKWWETLIPDLISGNRLVGVFFFDRTMISTNIPAAFAG